MEIKRIISGDSFELKVKGRIDGAGSNQMEINIIAAIREGAAKIFINCAESDFLCSAGVRVLLQYYRQMKNSQKTLRVINPSPNVESVLDLSGFKDLIVV